MAGVDLDQASGDRDRAAAAVSCLSQRRARRRVEAPGGAVRDDDRVEAPLRRASRTAPAASARPRWQSAGSSRVSTPSGQIGVVAQLVLELAEVEVALAVRPVEEREAEPLPERRRAGAARRSSWCVERADRPRRHLVVVGVAEDHVLVAVVGLGRLRRPASTPSRGRRRGRDSSDRRRRALHWRIDSFVSCQCCGVIASAWSLMLQKSSAEQKRAKSQASAGGCAPSPCSIGRLRTKASAEKVVWTCRSPKRICFAAGQGGASRPVCAAALRATGPAFGTRAGGGGARSFMLAATRREREQHGNGDAGGASHGSAARQPPSGGQPCTRQFSLSMKEPRPLERALDEICLLRAVSCGSSTGRAVGAGRSCDGTEMRRRRLLDDARERRATVQKVRCTATTIAGVVRGLVFAGAVGIGLVPAMSAAKPFDACRVSTNAAYDSCTAGAQERRGAGSGQVRQPCDCERGAGVSRPGRGGREGRPRQLRRTAQVPHRRVRQVRACSVQPGDRPGQLRHHRRQPVQSPAGGDHRGSATEPLWCDRTMAHATATAIEHGSRRRRRRCDYGWPHERFESASSVHDRLTLSS